MVEKQEIKPQVKQGLFTAQELSFAKVLAANEKKQRDQGLKKLVKWLTYRSAGKCEFTEDDFMTIWTGLFYSMFMSDKLLVQEELAENLSRLVHCFAEHEDAALLFISCFYKMMTQSWAGLDQYRIDKFCMLARRFLRQCLEYVAKKNWEMSLVKKVMRIYSKNVINESSALGLRLHFIEIFPEELAKVGREKLKTSVLTKMLMPFIKIMATTNDLRVRVQVNNFFTHLIKQTDVAIEYEEKFQAWKNMGFPSGDISSIVPDDSEAEPNEEVIPDEEEKEEEAMLESDMVLDPRAGSVHVVLPQIPVPAGSIIKMLKKYERLPDSTLKGRRMVNALITQFRTLKRKKCPYGIKKVPGAEKFGTPKYIDRCAQRLIKESLITKQSRRKKRQKIKLLNKQLRNEMEGASSDGDQIKEKKALKRKGLVENDPSPVKAKKIVEGISSSPDRVKEKKKESKGKGSPQKGKEALQKDLSAQQSGKGGQKSKQSPPAKGNQDVSPAPSEKEILKALNLKQARKRKSSEDSGSSPEKGTKGSPDKSLGELKGSPKKQNAIWEEVQVGKDGKENCSSSSSKPYLAENGEDFKGQAVKKRRTSTGWLVNAVEADEPLRSATIVTLEKKDPWAEPLQEGETEIFIPNKKVSAVGSTPVFWQKALSKANVSPNSTPKSNTPSSMSKNFSDAKRRISFNLSMNKFQEKTEYLEEVQRSPQIPFDSSKKPKQSALKKGLLPSPINPFYRSKKLLF